MQVSPNFNITGDRMYCPCCQEIEYSQDHVDKVQKIRTKMGVPFYVNSWYRCAAHNERIGASPRSTHVKGLAADISSKGWSGSQKWTFIQMATELGMSIGIYDTFFHVDDRSGTPVMWTG